MSNIFLYPKITKEMVENADYYSSLATFSFSIDSSNEERSINLEERGTDEVIIVNDLNGVWGIEHDNLVMTKHFKLSNPDVLFGIHGVAPVKSKLILAALISSKKSNQRSLSKITSFDINTRSIDIEKTIVFEKKKFRGSVEIQYVIILESIDSVGESEGHLAQISGTVLGVIEESMLHLDGSDSTFPVREESDKSKGLWRLNYNWLSLDDPFASSVELVINSSHNDYDLISPGTKKYNVELVKEIMISSVSLILIKAKEENAFDELDNGILFEEGSVGQVVGYYRNQYNITDTDINSIFERVGKGIRQ